MFYGHEHKAPTGNGKNAPPYGEVRFMGTDGMGITHYGVVVKCATCGEKYTIAAFHAQPGKPFG